MRPNPQETADLVIFTEECIQCIVQCIQLGKCQHTHRFWPLFSTKNVPFMILFKSNLQYIKCLHQIFVFVCHTYEIFSFPNKDALHKNLHIFFRSQGNAESNSAKTTYQKTVSLSSRTKHMSIERFS